MSYIIGQYNHNSASGDDNKFLDPITSGIPSRREDTGDSGTSEAALSIFTNECITGLELSTTEYYYFRCQIKRMDNTQQFSVKLVNYDNTIDGVEQYIKTVIVQGGDRDEWVNVEFLFHPIVQFDTILFQLKRTIDDYREMIRYPKIAYIQLGAINDLINLEIGNNIRLLKIGVQSHPGLTMCINGEEIHTSRSGIFEVKNGVIPVTFFSVVNAAKENDTTLEDWKNSINQQIDDIENDPTLTPEQKEAAYAAINSGKFFETSKTYAIDAFTLDYMYEN